jgi:hypothetical protein
MPPVVQIFGILMLILCLGAVTSEIVSNFKHKSKENGKI